MPKTDVAVLIERVRIAYPKGVGLGTPKVLADGIEKAIGVKFPNSYRDFLAKAGWIDAGGLVVIGLGPTKYKHLDVLHVTDSEREFEFPMPRELVPISDDGRGGYWCLDTAKMKNNECPVVYRDHELIADPKYRAERDSTSFAAFLKREIDEALPPTAKPADLDGAIAKLVKANRSQKTYPSYFPPARASAANIARAEKAIGRPIPPSARAVLGSLDGASLLDSRIVSVRADASAKHSLVALVKQLNRALGESEAARWMPVAVAPDNDWLYCLDLRTTDERVDCVGNDGEAMGEAIYKPQPIGRWLTKAAKRGFF